MKPRSLGAGLTLAIAALVLTLHGSAQSSAPRDVAVDTAKWLRSVRVTTPFGIAWPSDPINPRSVNTSLYGGSPGVVLFLIELNRATGEAAYLQDAKRGADDLMTKVASEPQYGLYDGLAGIAFTLGETWRATGDEKYRKAALAAVRTFETRVTAVGKGVQWNNVTDVMSGTAGVGLFLLYADETLKAPTARALAIRAGDRLLDLGEPSRGGARWARETTGGARQMPNFSNGTAGIAYFLATLYKATREQRFLDAALAGGRYLQAIAKTDGDVCLVPKDQPDTVDVFYLGWSHGPAGTARLFYQLSVVTNDKTWMTWVAKSANGVLKSGVPQARTTGFWNNVGQCDGNAGIAQFFLDLYGATQDRRYLDFATKMTADLLSRTTSDSRGTRWAHAEDRLKPDVRSAQTGFMQGASGIGMWFLHFDGSQRQRAPFVRFPDSPWP